MKTWYVIFLFLLAASALPGPVRAQQPGESRTDSQHQRTDTLAHPDTSSTLIHLVTADISVGINPKNDSLDLQKLIGHVVMSQSGTIFTCDSAIIDNLHNIMDAYGDIHINQDSLQVYGDYLHYLGNERQAFVRGNTRLVDGTMILTTPQLNYDMNARIGTYTEGGKLVNGTTTLTSGIGYYFADMKEAYFKKNVVLVDPQYILHSDSLQYNSATKLATFVAPTTITTNQSIIYTTSGYYDMAGGTALFDHRPTVVDSSQTFTSDSIFYNRSTGISIGKGRVVWTDTSDNMRVLSNYSVINDSLKTLMATQKPLLIYRMNTDTLFMASDSLFSAPQPVEDTLTGPGYMRMGGPGKPQPDTGSHRYFKAFFHVRIFSDSLQGKCDSVYYSFRDSTFRMYKNPILWTGDNQLSGDTIFMHTRDREASRMDLVRNAMVVNQTGPNFYNQIKGNFIYGYFQDNRLAWMHSTGNAESIYYAKDDSGAYIGVNKASSSVIDIYFDTARSQVQRVVFCRDAEGTTYPLGQVSPSDMLLNNFKWLAALRPKSKEELMQ